MFPACDGARRRLNDHSSRGGAQTASDSPAGACAQIRVIVLDCLVQSQNGFNCGKGHFAQIAPINSSAAACGSASESGTV